LRPEAAAQKRAAYSSPAAGRHSSSRRGTPGRSLRIGGCNATRIYVGRRNGDEGKVDHGFDKVSAADLQKRLKPLIRLTQLAQNRTLPIGKSMP
jgi:hypothetical protein